MNSDKKIFFIAFFISLILGALIKFSMPFSFINFGSKTVFNVPGLSYTENSSINNLNTGGVACGN